MMLSEPEGRHRISILAHHIYRGSGGQRRPRHIRVGDQSPRGKLGVKKITSAFLSSRNQQTNTNINSLVHALPDESRAMYRGRGRESGRNCCGYYSMDIWTKVIQGLWPHNLEWSACQIWQSVHVVKTFRNVLSHLNHGAYGGIRKSVSENKGLEWKLGDWSPTNLWGVTAPNIN